jgi:hypothetical protein
MKSSNTCRTWKAIRSWLLSKTMKTTRQAMTRTKKMMAKTGKTISKMEKRTKMTRTMKTPWKMKKSTYPATNISIS